MGQHLYEYCHVAAATLFLVAGVTALREYRSLRDRVVLSYGAMSLCAGGYCCYIAITWNLPKLGDFWIPWTAAGLATTFGATFFYLLTMQRFFGVRGRLFRAPLLFLAAISLFAIVDLLTYAVTKQSMMFIPVPREVATSHQWMLGEGAYSLLPTAEVIAAIFAFSFLFGVGTLAVHLVSVRSRDVLVYMGLCATASIILNETMVAMSVYGGVYLMAFTKAFETVRIHRDIRRRAREQVEQRLRQAEKMEAIGRVSGGVAHDFNNVLGVVSGCLSLIELDFGTRGPLVDHLRTAREALKTGKRMSRQLLDLARSEATRKEYIEVSEFLSSNAKLLSRMVSPDKHFEIKVAPEAGGITMTRGELAQVLMNLVVNADHATTEGGTVEVLAGRTVDQLGLSRRAPSVPSIRITVRDDGCGMPEELLGRVFEPFFTTKGERGTGMGLATTYSIVSQAGGRLEVESEVGRGTSVHVLLPRTELSRSELPRSELPRSKRRASA